MEAGYPQHRSTQTELENRGNEAISSVVMVSTIEGDVDIAGS